MTKYGDAAGSFSQTYDRDGNVASESRSLTGVSGDAGGNTQSFTYDGANRVTAASGLTDSASYAYDHDANRVSATIGSSTTTYTYDRSGALIARTDGGQGTNYTYDAYGNQTHAAVAVNSQTVYDYDLGDRLTEINPQGATHPTDFAFDALGRQASSTTGSVTTDYAYLGTSDTVWQLDDGTTTISASYEPSGARVAVDAGGTDAFVLSDLHGNAAALVNTADDAYLAADRYDSWGQSVDAYDSGSAYPTPWGFQSRLNVSPDADHPLYAFSARFYAPDAGTFTQLDSYAGSPGNPLSLNRYLYAEANPWTLIDPSGHVALAPVKEDGGTSYNSWVANNPELLSSSPSVTTKESASQPRPKPQTDVATAPTAQPGPTPSPAPVGAPCPTPGDCWSDQAMAAAAKVFAALFVVSSGGYVAAVVGPGALAAYQAGGVPGLCYWACDKIINVGGGLAEGAAGAPPGALAPGVGWGPVKPAVADRELQGIVDQLYREGATIGNLGTGDAVRAGYGHVQKAADRIVHLLRWLSRHPEASAADQHVAEALIQDLISALADDSYPGPPGWGP